MVNAQLKCANAALIDASNGASRITACARLTGDGNASGLASIFANSQACNSEFKPRIAAHASASAGASKRVRIGASNSQSSP